MQITIVGGAFGMYGYLPAIIGCCDATILLPKKYQQTILARNDICQFYNKVEWVRDHDAIFNLCDAVIIATPPRQQYDLIQECLRHENITHIFLEKPLAVSPALGEELLHSLELSGKKFRIGYNFRFTNWGKNILQHGKGINNIIWSFRAHHYTHKINTWKRCHEEGGGALRFYGIHVIALLAEAGYRNVVFSKITRDSQDGIESWEAKLTGPDLVTCSLSVATNSDSLQFKLQSYNDNYSFLHPFENHSSILSSLDQRIPCLTEGLLDLFHKPDFFYDWYKYANVLWNNIENSLL